MKNISIITFLFMVCIVFSPIFNKNKQYVNSQCSPNSAIYVSHKEYNTLPLAPKYPKQKPKYIKVN